MMTIQVIPLKYHLGSYFYFKEVFWDVKTKKVSVLVLYGVTGSLWRGMSE